ncbi:replicative helicase loader/inhibitor [Paenibacillus contaminans]|uniref:replicative helicase loader/inhibitor n=1 Tax=Paenibacillus contaminans TaxID=450362 RepID=UPI0013142108|nr:replicative helicase loader/inhibitor [Paenibacillus contaminans]
MDNNQVLDILRFIKGAYHRFEINEDMPRVWMSILQKEDYDVVMQRLERHIRTSRYEPTIHDLITHSGEELERLRQQREEEINANPLQAM